jgi:hypothetical protein
MMNTEECDKGIHLSIHPSIHPSIYLSISLIHSDPTDVPGGKNAELRLMILGRFVLSCSCCSASSENPMDLTWKPHTLALENG